MIKLEERSEYAQEHLDRLQSCASVVIETDAILVSAKAAAEAASAHVVGVTLAEELVKKSRQ